MKNLKKVLSLVLAMAMALSLMTVAFAADAKDFADYDKVSYKEAVDVMVAAGVFNGAEGNNFDANGELTREQAAKIITYMMVGQEKADKLVATAAPYADVAANRWSAGAIAWCTEQGILAGSNGKFNPTGKLTGLAFSKMLLVALGYDAKIEGLEGPSWAINTATLALGDASLDKGMGNISLSAILSREEAAQMAFNAMKADLVQYENKGTNIKLSDGTTVVIGATSAKTYNNDAKIKNNLRDTAGKVQFAEKYCADLKKTGTESDKFGRPASEWKFKNNTIGTYADKADESYEGEVTKGTLYSLVGKSTADKTGYYYSSIASFDKTYKLTQYVDGAEFTGTTDKEDYLTSGSSATAKNTVNGSVSDVFVNDDNSTITIVTINTFVAKATADYSKVNKSLAVRDLGGHSIAKISNEDFDVTGYAKDDYILYTYAKGAIQTIEKAEIVSGNVDTYTVGKNVTIGGTKYNYSGMVANTNGGKDAAYTIGKTATVALDQQGNVIVVDELVANDDNYVFVTAAGYGDARRTSVIADITTPDGKETTGVTLKKVMGSDNKDIMAATKDGWYTYSVSGNKYTLTGDATKQYYATVNSGNLVENGKININCTSASGQNKATKANSKTVFVIKDKDDVVTVYNGIAKVPTISANSATTAYYYNGSDGYAKYVYVDVANTARIDDKSDASSDVFYVLNQSGKVYAADDNEYYTLDVLKNGNVEKLDVETGADNLADQVDSLLYKLKTNSKNQGASATAVVGNLNTAKYADTMNNYYVSYSNNVLNLAKSDKTTAKDMVVTDDAVIYVVLKSGDALMNDKDASYEVYTMSAEQLDGFLNGRTVTGTVTGLTADSDSDTFKTIYMTITASTEV